MDKQAILNKIIEELTAELHLLIEAARDAHENATGDESRSESKYDTRALESSYLAEGQSRQAEEIRESLDIYRSLSLRDFGSADGIALTALVEINWSDTKEWHFIGPRRGGTTIEIEGTPIMIVTPQSPLGRKLMGKMEGATLPSDPTVPQKPPVITSVC